MPAEKVCSTCKVSKPLSEFRRCNQCVDCIKEYARQYNARPYVKAMKLAHQQTDHGKLTLKTATKRWRDNNMHKSSASHKVDYARRIGELAKEPCRDCGAETVHGHHPDYSQPLDVIWLCPQHHKAEHKRLRAL